MCNNTSQLNNLIRGLKKQTNVLQTLYSNFRNWFISLTVLRFLLTGIIYRYIIAILFQRPNFFKDNISLEIFLFCVFLFYGLLFSASRTVLRKKIQKFREFCKDTFRKCDEIVDYTDWSDFRKRSLDDNKRLRAQYIINTIYQIRTYKFFPYRTENSYFHFLFILNRFMDVLISLGLILIIGYSIYTTF